MSSEFGVGGGRETGGGDSLGGSHDGRNSLRGRVLFVTVAAALVAITVIAMLDRNATVVVALFWVLGPTAAIVTTALVLWWTVENDSSSADVLHVTKWAAAGSVVLGISGGLTVYVQYLRGSVDALSPIPGYEWACGGFVIGSVVGVYSAGRRVRERQLRRERRKAQSLAETLSVLNRVLRHDIRNDVNVVEGYVDLIAEEAEGADDHVAVVRDHTERIVELAEYARETERLVAEDNAGVRRLDVVERLERVCRDVESAFPDATVATEFPPRAEVRAHRLVDSAFENLVENAVEHGSTSRQPSADDAVRHDPTTPRSQARENAVEHHQDDAPEVRVSVEREADAVAVVVADRGPGIPDDEVAVLESGTESALEHSDGMGLWLVNWIVTYSGGEVEFAENEPTGSRITVRLPAADA